MTETLYAVTAAFAEESSKYGILRLRYLHEYKREMYCELLLTGKLAEHCKAIDTAALEQSEQIQANWLKAHPMPLEDTL